MKMTERFLSAFKDISIGLESQRGKESSSIGEQDEILERFRVRVEVGRITREENSKDHFCVYFAAIDYKEGEVFIGHHKKSDLWLFNGGHIDQGETPIEAVLREIEEEWGIPVSASQIGEPTFLTITNIISNPSGRPCSVHYDIWYFVKADKATFKPDQSLLSTEFHQTSWMKPREAQELVLDPNTLRALQMIDKSLQS